MASRIATWMVGRYASRPTQWRISGRSLHSAVTLQSLKLKMPSLSPTMEEGQIVKWLKAEGEQVSAGDVLCDVQTDKAVVSMEADEDGVLAKIIKDGNSGTVKVGTLIGVMAEEGEEWKEVAADPTILEEYSGGDSPAPLEKQSTDSSSSAEASGGSTPGSTVKMPALSPTMTEGTIVKWCKQEGEKLEAGDILCEIQTDKAVVSMEADEEGILAKILVAEGTPGIEIGSMIALTVEEGEDWRDVQIPAVTKVVSAIPETSAEKEPMEANLEKSEPVVHQHAEVEFKHYINVGPASNLLMAKYGLTPEKIVSTGPKGILKADILKHIKDQKVQPPDLSSVTPSTAGQIQVQPISARSPGATSTTQGPGYTDIPLTSIRSVIAKRLLQSKQTSPHGHATSECNIDAITNIRRDLLELGGVKISVNDVVIKAVATALQYVPEININAVGEDDFQMMPNVDVSVAVATDEGLITPILKDVPSLSLQGISSTVKELAIRARNGQLKLDEFQGGTFTVSNLGMFGIRDFTAIINPPQGAILAVGKGFEEINPSTGKPSTVMKATLSFDRRFIDEQIAADFMATFQKVMEHPEYMNIGPVPIVRASKASLKL